MEDQGKILNMCVSYGEGVSRVQKQNIGERERLTNGQEPREDNGRLD